MRFIKDMPFLTYNIATDFYLAPFNPGEYTKKISIKPYFCLSGLSPLNSTSLDIPKFIKLSVLSQQIQQTIAGTFGNKNYWVLAEISNCKFYLAKNYYYFDLIEKDPSGNTLLTSLKATAWSAAVNNIRYFEKVTGQKFDNNIQVLVCVAVEYHIAYGLKVNLLDVNPMFTLGNLERQRFETLARLVNENAPFVELRNGEYHTFNQRLALNPVIQHIALVASPNSEGYVDFRHELLHNHYNYAFQIDEYATQVQGGDADIQMVNRLVEIFNSRRQYDAVVIVRGGGAKADFLAFDSYQLAKAIARFPIPVFTGIGHTINESIADLMAFKAAKTPTKVAEIILSHNRFFEEKIINLQKQVVFKTKEIIGESRLILSRQISLTHQHFRGMITQNRESLTGRLAIIQQLSMGKLLNAGHALSQCNQNIKVGTHLLFKRHHFLLHSHAQLLKHLSPDAVLKRGYALVVQNQQIMVSGVSILEGNEINVLLADAKITSTVTQKIMHHHGTTNI